MKGWALDRISPSHRPLAERPIYRVEPLRAVRGTGIIHTISGPLCRSAQRDSTMPKVSIRFAPGQAAQPFAAA